MFLSLDDPDPYTRWLMSVDLGILYFGFCVLRSFVLCLDALLDALIGYSTQLGWKSDRELSAKSYEHSAQLVTVLGRGCYSIFEDTKLSNFLVWHEGYLHPEYALEHDHVTLFGITPTHAFFSITDPELDIHNTADVPFLYAKKFFASKQLIIMPHFSLHRLAQRVGDPTENGRRLTFIDNTARCGSTLLSAMLNTVPGIRVLSEPRTVKFLYSLHIAGKISTAEFGPLVRSSIRLHCKPEKRTTVEHFVIKHCSLVPGPILYPHFPHADYIFNTRALKGTLSSMRQLECASQPITKLLEKITRTLYSDIYVIPLDDVEWWQQYKAVQHCNTTFLKIFTFNHASQMSDFLRKPKIHSMVVFFEDLVSNPEQECRRLFQHMNIGLEHVTAALDALKQDSQKGTFGARGVRPKISEEEFDELESYLQSLPGDPRLSCHLSAESYKNLVNSKLNEAE